MFVTCLFAVLDPASGRLRYANAGQDLPYLRTAEGVVELRATGMPLGLLPDMEYEEKEVVLEPGQEVLLHSDGVVEAHNPDREMFGFPRLKRLVAEPVTGGELIDLVLADLSRFTGPGWEQEDDITLVALSRLPVHAAVAAGPHRTRPCPSPATPACWPRSRWRASRAASDRCSRCSPRPSSRSDCRRRGGTRSPPRSRRRR